MKELTPEQRAKKKEQARAWYQANKEKVKARVRQWEIDNPEKAASNHQKAVAKYQNENKDEIRQKWYAWRNERYAQERLEVLKHYGNACTCCKEDKPEFLAIDHINGGGAKHRKEIKGKYRGIYDFLRKNNFPEGYRVLCHNCNCAIGFYGYCPHQANR